MKNIIFSFILIFQCFFLKAQVDLGLPVATGKGGAATSIIKDYEALGINPANLGLESSYPFSIGILNFGLNVHSQALNFNQLYQGITHPNDTFTTVQKKNYAELFTSNQGLNVYSHLMWFGVSLASQKLGGLAMNLRDRVFIHTGLSKNAADILFNGINSQVYQNSAVLKKYISEVVYGTEFQFFHVREFNIAYGRSILKKKKLELLGGVGLKYIWGLGNIDVKIDSNNVVGNAALSQQYHYAYDSLKNFVPDKTSGLFKPAGTGYAFDFASTLILNEKLKLAVALTDIGKIKWDKNVLIAIDTLMPKLDSSSTGINSFNINNQLNFFYGNNGFTAYKNGTLFTNPFPAKMRIGAGIVLTKNFEVSADAVFPLAQANGNIQIPYFALGGELSLLENTLKISSGIAGNGIYGFNVPLGVIFGTFAVFDFAIATDDILTFFAKSKNPNASLAVGLLRFNIYSKN